MSAVAPATAGITDRLARLPVIGALLAPYLGSYILVTRYSASLPALAAHLPCSLPRRAFVFEDGAMKEVRPFVDGKETLDYPELGPVEVMHIGHPEPFTLSRFIEGVRDADDKATFPRRS